MNKDFTDMLLAGFIIWSTAEIAIGKEFKTIDLKTILSNSIGICTGVFMARIGAKIVKSIL